MLRPPVPILFAMPATLSLPLDQCPALTTWEGEPQACHKSPGHTDSADASRRVHHDITTGLRWPARPGDADPLAAHVRVSSRRGF